MGHVFDADTVRGVLGHMNTDHADDNVLIVRAFSPHSDAVRSEMVGFDGDGGQWRVTTGETDEIVRVPWPAGPITERRDVRREIVALYDAACVRLGIPPRPHA